MGGGNSKLLLELFSPGPPFAFQSLSSLEDEQSSLLHFPLILLVTYSSPPFASSFRESSCYKSGSVKIRSLDGVVGLKKRDGHTPGGARIVVQTRRIVLSYQVRSQMSRSAVWVYIVSARSCTVYSLSAENNAVHKQSIKSDFKTVLSIYKIAEQVNLMLRGICLTGRFYLNLLQ